MTVINRQRGTGAPEDVIRRRREIVADYMSRGIEIFSIISEAWIMEGIFNPHSGDPYVHQVYINDKNWVKQQWANSINEKAEFLIGDVIAKHKIIFQRAMRDGDYVAALNSMKGVREILDLDKPKGSRAIKKAADEKNYLHQTGGMTEAESNQKAVMLENSPAVLGEMLQILASVGAIDAALVTESQQLKEAKELQNSLNGDNEPETVPAQRNGKH